MHCWATFSHILSFVLALSGCNQTPFLFNSFKSRIWCRSLTGVIFFLLTVLATSSWVLWFYSIGNTLNWKNLRTPQISYSSALLPEFVISFSPGYLVVQSIDLWCLLVLGISKHFMASLIVLPPPFICSMCQEEPSGLLLPTDFQFLAKY